MGIAISFGCFSVSTSHPQDGSADLVIGPLQAWLGWNSMGLVWDGRFDFIIDTSSYRPEGGRWFETWRESEDATGGYLFGRVWRKVDLRTSAGDDQKGI